MGERDTKPFELTASLEDYLEAIGGLVEAHGHAHTTDIAKRLKVSMPSVSNALAVLSRHGYIYYDTNYPVTLTASGEQEAARVTRRHRVLMEFLRDVLQLDAESASATACRMEHVTDERLIGRLEVLKETLLGERPIRGLRQRLTEAYGDVEC